MVTKEKVGTMDGKEETFVRSKFKEYYAKHWTAGPDEIASREFGFGSWTKAIESRHYAFKDEKELNSYLGRNAPFFISSSIAYYKYPAGRPIQKKEWLKGDLAFDIDANQLGCECIAKHGKDWVCDQCLEKSKECAQRLIDDYLIKEFGAQKEEISVNFSGNRGYHIRVKKRFDNLKGYARREIADYVNGNGIEIDDLFIQDVVRKRNIGPKLTDGGWKGKIAQVFIENLKNRTLDKIGITKRTADRLYEKTDLVKNLENGNWDALYVGNKKRFYSSLIKNITAIHGCFVDEGVTFDTSKILRMEDSLHGKSGMVAKRMRLSDLKGFNPLKHAFVFGNDLMEVKMGKVQEITLKGEKFGPYDGETVGIPEYAAVYFLCKKVATLP